MKKLLLILTLALACSSVFGQVEKARATKFSIKVEGEEWQESEEINVLIVFDFDKERITIYSEQLQEYDILSISEAGIDENGDDVTILDCVDEQGIRCTSYLMVRSNGALQLYFSYSNVSWAYDLTLV